MLHLTASPCAKCLSMLSGHLEAVARCHKRPCMTDVGCIVFGCPVFGSPRQCVLCRYGNGAFCIDMPRGCVLVMDAGGYAVTGVKHCVRPMDMAGVFGSSIRCYVFVTLFSMSAPRCRSIRIPKAARQQNF